MRRLACTLFVLLAACSSTREADSQPMVSPPSNPAPEVAQKKPAPPARTALDAKPAAVPMPAVPPIQKSARGTANNEARDQGGELARNAFVIGRLPEAGQRASFPFEAKAGEQSLFEITASAYSRASAGRVRMSIEDSSGKVAWQSERDVAVIWRDFTAFSPDSAGAWTYSLTILEGGYRFALVRHSDYPKLDGKPLDLASQPLVHGHLPSSDTVATFRIPVRAGEDLALKLVGTREEAREEARRGATDMSAMMSGRMETQPAAGRMGGGGKLQFQRFEMEVLGEGVVLGPIGSYLRIQPVKDGALEVRVRARYAALGGGLFDLSVERPLSLLHVHGVVVDSEDQPIPDVEVRFLREPDADVVGSTRTNAAGEYEATVLEGDLAVQMLRGDTPAIAAVRVRVAADMQVDLMFQPGRPARGR
ncbi:MAG TPA: hypothetical protein VK843_06015 [Planctomycetota bacterium]|nr:hypothetical protein [Planctomycetota bacterium]